MWLFGDEHFVTEVGSMNQFFYWINEDGQKELITAPLDGGIILPGITRECVLEIARNPEKFGINFGEDVIRVTERRFTMGEVCKAVKEGRMLEAFGCGTAAVVTPVDCIGYNGWDYHIPCGEDGKIGDMAKMFWQILTGIQYGKIEHPWSYKIN